MNTALTGRILFFLLMASILFSACQEEQEPLPKPVDPADLKYEGAWTGSTSQMKLLTFTIQNTDTAPVVLSCKYGFLQDGEYKQHQISSPTGLSVIDNGHFLLELPEGGNLEGNFETEDLCRGQLVVPEDLTGVPVMHSFNAITDTFPDNLYSPAHARFKAGWRHYDYRQNFDFLFPFTENISTDTGIIVSSSINRNSGNPESTKLIEIRAGHLDSIGEILDFFSPGKKYYSKFAAYGFEIIFYNPEEYFNPYSTSEYTGNQAGSNFEILEFREIETFSETRRLFRFSVKFNCKVYRHWGRTVKITNGYYTGYIDGSPE